MFPLLMGASAGSGILGSVIDSGLSSWSSGKNMRQQNRYDRDAAYMNYMANLGLMQYQNCYNQPKNQMKRYEAAGLNPNLIYGQQNLSASPGCNVMTNNARANFQPSGAGAAIDRTMNSLAKYYSVENMRAQNDNLLEQNANMRAQNEVYRAQARKSWEDAVNVRLQNQYDLHRNYRFEVTGYDGRGGFSNWLATGLDNSLRQGGNALAKTRLGDLYAHYMYDSEKKPESVPVITVEKPARRSNWVARQFHKAGRWFDRRFGYADD